MSAIAKNYSVLSFKVDKNESISMKKYISITYEHTYNIQKLIKSEDWGDYNKKLYYYIDYTFRARYYDNKIKVYRFNNGKSIGLFCLNLYKQNDTKNSEPLYLIFRLNTDATKYQTWSVDSNSKNIGLYCKTKKEIQKSYNIKLDDIPDSYEYKVPKIYHDSIPNFNWNEIFRKVLNRKFGGNTKSMINSCFNANGIMLNGSRMRQELFKPFKYAFKRAIKIDKKHGTYITPALFFNKYGYELMYQVMLDIEYPYNSGKTTKFAAVIDSCYNFVRLISTDMANKNARLVRASTIVKIEPKIEQKTNEKTLDISDITPAVSVISSSSVANSISSIPSLNLSSVSNSSNDSVCSNNSGVLYPRFYKKEMIRDIMYSNGKVYETVTSINKDVTSLLEDNKAIKNEYIKCYTIDECDKDIVIELLLNHQLKIKSFHEICQMSINNEVETVATTIMTNDCKVLRSNMHSYMNNITQNGCIKTPIIIGNNYNNKSANMFTNNVNSFV